MEELRSRRPLGAAVLVLALIGVASSCNDATVQPLTGPGKTVKTSTGTALPSVYPSDGSYGWVFDGSNDSLRSGAFTTGDQVTPILTTTDPAYVGWSWASGAGPNASNAIKRTYPISGGDIAPAFFYTLPIGQKKLYVRFYYKQSNPFNTDGTTSNQNWVSLLRFDDAYGDGVLSVSGAPGGALASGWDAWSASPSMGTFNLNTALGSWTCYEVMADLTTSGQAHQTVWVNDTQVLDNTVSGSAVNSPVTSMPILQFFGTINGMNTSSTAWVTMIGVSTQRLGCPSTSAVTTASASSLAIVTQPSSSAQSGVAFAQQPVVQLHDAANNPVNQAGVVVAAAIASGTGTLGGTATATTDSTGTARFSSLSITGTAGTYTLRFASPGLTGATSSPITIAAATPSAAALAIATQPSSTAQSGAVLAQQPVIQVVDASNQPVSQSGVVVTAAIASGGGTLGGTTSATTNASGVAAFANLSIGGTTGSRTLRFSATGLTAATSNTISITAGPAKKLTITMQPSSTADSGVAFAQQPVIQLRDAWNNAVNQSGVSVTAAVASGGGVLSGTTTVATSATGAATFTNLAINGSGSQTLGFASAGLTGATSTAITVSSGSVSSTGSGGSSSLPNVYPTDGTPGWMFNGSNTTNESGAFTTGDGVTAFLSTTDPSYMGWSVGQGEGPNGLNAVKRTYPISSSNVGPAFFLVLPKPQKLIYVRFFYKQGNPFNYNGSTSNQDWEKLVRLLTPTGGQILTPGVQPGGQLISGWDSWDAYYNGGFTAQSTWSMNRHLGTWNCYEVMLDLTVANQAHQTMWVNGNQVLDATVSGSGVTSSSTSIGILQFDGTINSMASSSTAWFTMIGVSSQRMGCPAGYSFPY